jgi:hypothetical protein
MMQTFKVNKWFGSIIKSRQSVMKNNFRNTDLNLLKYNLIHDITFSLITAFRPNAYSVSYIIHINFMESVFINPQATFTTCSDKIY